MFTEPLDNQLWHFIAFSAGTGGSMLIIGSAAGVVAMGMEKIDFFLVLEKDFLASTCIGFIVGSCLVHDTSNNLYKNLINREILGCFLKQFINKKVVTKLREL